MNERQNESRITWNYTVLHERKNLDELDKFCNGEQQDNTRKLVRIQCTDVIFNTFYRKFFKKYKNTVKKIEELFSEEGQNFPEREPSGGGIINRQLDSEPTLAHQKSDRWSQMLLLENMKSPWCPWTLLEQGHIATSCFSPVVGMLRICVQIKSGSILNKNAKFHVT